MPRADLNGSTGAAQLLGHVDARGDVVNDPIHTFNELVTSDGATSLWSVRLGGLS